jgi:hypothetical protein
MYALRVPLARRPWRSDRSRLRSLLGLGFPVGCTSIYICTSIKQYKHLTFSGTPLSNKYLSSGIIWLSKKCNLSKATAQLSLFGKESFVDLDFDQIEAVKMDSNDSDL